MPHKKIDSESKESSPFNNLVEKVVHKFVDWNAYDTLNLEEARKSEIAREKARHILYSLGTVTDTIIEEMAQEQGRIQFFQTAIEIMQERKREDKAQQLEVLRPFIELSIPENENLKLKLRDQIIKNTRDSAEILVKSFVGEEIMELLCRDPKVQATYLDRFQKFWQPYMDLNIDPTLGNSNF